MATYHRMSSMQLVAVATGGEISRDKIINCHRVPPNLHYEIGTSIPPADAIKAIADALEVSTDSLLSDENVEIKDKELFNKFQVIQEMNGDTKQMVVRFLDLAIRDFKARQAYGS